MAKATKRVQLPRLPKALKDGDVTAILLAACAIGYANAMVRAFPLIQPEEILTLYANELRDLAASVPIQARRILRQAALYLIHTEPEV